MAEGKGVNPGPFSHLAGIEKAGIDVQILSPRPNQMMHSHNSGNVVRYFSQICNNLIYRHTQLWPGKFVGIAGLPQIAGEPLDAAVQEFERCVTELGFKGCMFNPDPFEIQVCQHLRCGIIIGIRYLRNSAN